MSVFNMFIKIFLVLSVFCVEVVCGKLPVSEPVCLSRFDYDAKLLERLIHLENKMKQLEEKSLADSEKLQEQSEAFKESQAATFDVMKTKGNQLEASVEAKLTEMERSWAVTISDQKAFVAGVKTTLEMMQSGVNASLAKFAADVKKPGTAFSVRYTGSHSPGTNTLLIFDTSSMNTDGIYDTGTGYFSTRTDGLYLFTVHLCSYKSKTLEFHITVNDNVIMSSRGYDEDGYPCTSSSAVATLSVRDKVAVKSGSGSSGPVLLCSIYRWCTFIGVLIK